MVHDQESVDKLYAWRLVCEKWLNKEHALNISKFKVVKQNEEYFDRIGAKKMKIWIISYLDLWLNNILKHKLMWS
jgi:hypothetical protein